MSVADVIQAVSLALVAGALLVTAFQTRMSARQAAEAGQQTAAANAALQQNVYQNLVTRHNDFRISFFKDDPAMLRWHLEKRGYKASTDETNRRILYVLCKLDVHEAAYLSYSSGILDDLAGSPWLRVLEVDLRVHEFAAVWPAARRFYASGFVAYVDALLAASSVEHPGEVGE